jgi:hypothetical protein
MWGREYEPRSSSSLLLLPLYLGIMSGLPVDTAGAEITGENSYCFRCHSMATLSYLDFERGGIVDLSVDPVKFSRSNHSDLKCLDCHMDTLEVFPHPETVRRENLHCLDCHKEDARFEKYRFPYIEREFHGSVHIGRLPNSFTCFSCHQPHVFDLPAEGDDIRTIVVNSNRLCLACHSSPILFAELSSRPIPLLEQSHDWLPEPRLHWEHVRCVECHTSHEKGFSHRILSADSAERKCEQCHTRNSILLTKLYRHKTEENRQKAGFVNSAVLNDAYVVGMTRNVVLDWASGLLFALTFVGIAGHAAIRIVTSRRRHDEE